MRFIWKSAVKDLRRLRREPATLIIWLGVPTFIALILTLVFGRGAARPQGELLIVDEDRGIGASLVSGAFSQGSLAGMITVNKVDRAEGRRRIDQGKASALLIIPSGFSAAFFQNKPTKLELIRNPAQRILPEMIEETLSMTTDGAFYIQSNAGHSLSAIPRAGPLPAAGIAQNAASINQAFGHLQKYLAPPLIQVQTTVVKDETEKPGGFAALFFPGMLYMAVFFIAGGMAADLWRERTSGALRRMVTTPANLGAFLAGKLVAATLVLLTVGTLGLVLGHWLIDLPVANFALAVIWLTLSGAGLYLMMMLIQSLAASERVANLLANLITLPLAMLGGNFFPFEAMPPGLARIGKLTPNGWSMMELKAILAGSFHSSVLLWVAVFLMATWLLTSWRIRRAPC
jgi:ABC-2 type transport system permease protein